MARGSILLNKKTRKVDCIRAARVDVFRDGDYIVFLYNKNIRGRHKDPVMALQAMPDNNLRKRIVRILDGGHLSPDNLQARFPDFEIEAKWPEF